MPAGVVWKVLVVAAQQIGAEITARVVPHLTDIRPPAARPRWKTRPAFDKTADGTASGTAAAGSS